MGLVTSNIFFADEAPRYQTALAVNMAFPCAAIVFTVGYSLYLRFLNHRLDKAEFRSTEGEASTGQAHFRYQA